jgi:hypothetical protein
MKGIELPINILVIIAVAVIVLLGVIALYFSGFMGPAKLLDQNSAKQKYCAIIMRSPTGCQGQTLLNTIGISDFDADQDGNSGAAETGTGWIWGTACPTLPTAAGSGDNLASLLACYYGITSESDGLKSCGCA